MGLYDATVISTTPGDIDSPFAPPLGWDGGRAEYFALLRSRYDNEFDQYQRIRFIANFAKRCPVKAIGPFAKEALQVLARINEMRN